MGETGGMMGLGTEERDKFTTCNEIDQLYYSLLLAFTTPAFRQKIDMYMYHVYFMYNRVYERPLLLVLVLVLILFIVCTYTILILYTKHKIFGAKLRFHKFEFMNCHTKSKLRRFQIFDALDFRRV